MLDLYLLVIGQDEAECAIFDGKDADCELHVVTNSEDRSIAVVANEHLKKCSRTVFGLIHPDVSFESGALDAFHAAALAGQVCGLVGRGLDGMYYWCHQNPGKVSTLDDCSVFFRADSCLTFDEQLCGSFYCYVTDLCLQAQKRDIPVVVPAAKANHVGKRFFTDYGARQAGWNECLDRLRKKWGDTPFMTT